MPENYYVFTRRQLYDLLKGGIEMMIEYRDRHAHTEYNATVAAALEMLDGLDAERELQQEAGHIVTSQIIPIFIATEPKDLELIP